MSKNVLSSSKLMFLQDLQNSQRNCAQDVLLFSLLMTNESPFPYVAFWEFHLFLVVEQFLSVFVNLDYNSLLLTIQFPDTLTPEVQQCLWSASPKCISMKFVVGGSPLCAGIRSSSFSLDKCCHGLFFHTCQCGFHEHFF